MKFFANKLNGNYLRSVLPGTDVEVDYVKAAIAYGSDASTVLANCLENSRRLDLWMRYDHTVPVHPKLLRTLLEKFQSNIFCRLIPDVLHSKVIWWKGYGVYVGSANLTERAWISNIEFGIFLSEAELEDSGEIREVEAFFEQLESCEAALQLTAEIIEEQEQLFRSRSTLISRLDDESKNKRSVAVWGGPVEAFTKRKALDVRRTRFVKEWLDGLTILRSLSDVADQYRPRWLREDVPVTWQADQFLHAYYFNEVVDGNKHPYEDHYARNKQNPAAAVTNALKWWAALPSPPSEEDVNCHQRAPVILRLLSKTHISKLTQDEFVELCKSNHSTMDHLRRVRKDLLAVNSVGSLSQIDRVDAFAALLWQRRNVRGESVIDLLQYVFDGGPAAALPNRIYDVTHLEDRRIPHFGINQVAELTGWARPELCSPRNGRTSKALRALGYDVQVY